MTKTIAEELIERSQRLLDSIEQQDWETYAELCDPKLTAFEPEAVGHLVAGMDFHRFYFDLEGRENPSRSTISSPNFRIMGDTAVVTYVRLKQQIDNANRPVTSAYEETRIWQRQDGIWKHVHFHRSALRQIRL